MKIRSIVQLKPIQLQENGFVFPFNSFTKIILDRKSPTLQKCHQVIFQQGERYGTVGDCAQCIDAQELLELEAKGMIEIVRPRLDHKPKPKTKTKKRAVKL